MDFKYSKGSVSFQISRVVFIVSCIVSCINDCMTDLNTFSEKRDQLKWETFPCPWKENVLVRNGHMISGDITTLS